MTVRYIVGDTLEVTRTMPDASVDLDRERLGMFLEVEYHDREPAA